MKDSKAQSLSRYVDVLTQRTEQAQQALSQAQAQLHRSKAQLERLQHMENAAQLKNSTANVALYLNAAGFRSSLMDMAQQFKDVCSAQQLDVQHAENHMQSAMRRQESMRSVLCRKQAESLLEQARQGQKSMDELAGQAWLRHRKASAQGSGSC